MLFLSNMFAVLAIIGIIVFIISIVWILICTIRKTHNKKAAGLAFCSIFIVVISFVFGPMAERSYEKNLKSKEYSYADLKDMQEIFIYEWLLEMEKLSDIESHGTSSNEEEQQLHLFKVSSEYAKKIEEKHKEYPIGENVIVTGYIAEPVERSKDGFMVRQGVGQILFYLKHNENDDTWDSFTCVTDDKSVLEIKDNTPVKIEGIFLDPKMFGSNNDLYDCKILEIGETENVEEETFMTLAPKIE